MGVCPVGVAQSVARTKPLLQASQPPNPKIIPPAQDQTVKLDSQTRISAERPIPLQVLFSLSDYSECLELALEWGIRRPAVVGEALNDKLSRAVGRRLFLSQSCSSPTRAQCSIRFPGGSVCRDLDTGGAGRPLSRSQQPLPCFCPRS